MVRLHFSHNRQPAHFVTDFLRPQNLTLKINSSNEVTVTWEHPSVKNFYLNVSSEGTTENYPVTPDSCQHTYGRSVRQKPYRRRLHF
jgi:hypothetical protein